MFGYSNKDKDKPTANAPDTQEAVATQLFNSPPPAHNVPEPAAAVNESTSPLDQEVIDRLTRLAQSMRGRQFYVAIDNHTSYSVTYIGEVLLFALRMMNDLHMHGSVTADMGKKWLDNQLPITQSTPIEIGPKEFMIYLKMAVNNDPLKLLNLGPRGLKALEYLIDPTLHVAHTRPPTH